MVVVPRTTAPSLGLLVRAVKELAAVQESTRAERGQQAAAEGPRLPVQMALRPLAEALVVVVRQYLAPHMQAAVVVVDSPEQRAAAVVLAVAARAAPATVLTLLPRQERLIRAAAVVVDAI